MGSRKRKSMFVTRIRSRVIWNGMGRTYKGSGRKWKGNISSCKGKHVKQDQ